ncbi:hypothetical protein KUA49_011820 [Segatella copri]|uniref:hypothetical protein n=1 Tax=Segatella copri TaxID=165179 RepID=UPI00211518C1|nr:hypothetical protein [Segatella copri]WOZ83838.1 hypothetical protein KUA49_011820 [Segatella copri]
MSVQNETMQHLIAFNEFRGGNKGSACCQPLSEYDKTISLPWLHEMVLQIRGEKSIRSVDRADEAKIAKAQQRIKGQLPFRCAHYYRFLKNRRAQDNADPTAFLFQTTVDVDEAEYVDQAIERARVLNCSDTIWKGMLLHLEYSARKKLHIDIRMPVGMTIEETQRAYCEALGVPYDESCISPERMIYITDKDSEIYRSKEWYGVLPAEEISLRREAFVKRGLTIDGRGVAVNSLKLKVNSLQKVNNLELKVNSNHKVQSSNLKVQSKDNVQSNRFQGTNGDNAVYAGTAAQPAQPVDSHRVDDSHLSPAGDAQDVGGVATQEASEKNLIAFELFKEAAGLSGMDIDTVGSRHSSLLAIMSAGASRVMSEEELMKVVAKKMPSYYEERDCHQLIHDFYAKYGDSSKPFSRDVIRINATAEKAASGLVGGTIMGDAGYSLLAGDCKSPGRLAGFNSDVQSEDDEYPAPPPMPEKLPKLVELLVSKTPDIYKPAVACAIFPPLATHLWRTRFRYIDNVEHEATLSVCLLAGTGAGKSCVQMPINYIMEDIRKRDKENMRREKEWKDEMVRKGANKDKRKRPENLIIQEIDADMTNPAFVMRTAEAQEHFLYTSMNELDQFDALRGMGNQQFRIMCLAFDPGNTFGQQRVGVQSVTERVTIRFNWNASSTIDKGQRYFSKVLIDGPLSRINFCTIPEREIGEDIPVYGTYDEAYRTALKPYIENLCMATGLVDCPEAFQLATVLKNENAEFARTSQNRIYENFSFRANVIAYLKACVLYVANGFKWEPEIDDFIRWSERYDLWCKMRFFGDMIAKEMNSAERSSKRGPENLLQLLPDVFTLSQLEALRLEHGLEQKGTKGIIRQWVHRQYIERIKPQGEDGRDSYSCDSFRKLKYRHDL